MIDKTIKWKRNGKVSDNTISISSMQITKGAIPSSGGASSPPASGMEYGMSISYDIVDGSGVIVSRGQHNMTLTGGKIPSIQECLQTIAEVFPKE